MTIHKLAHTITAKGMYILYWLHGQTTTAPTEPLQLKTMNATTLTAKARTAFSIALGIAQAIAILTIAPERTRQREIAAAKRSIAERKAQLANRKAEIEIELQELKAVLPTAPAPTPQPELIPELPNPWELETETVNPAAIATVPAQKSQLCLPAAPELKPELEPKAKKTAKPKATKPVQTATPTPPNSYEKKTIRELKAIASQQKIKGYGKLTKAQLIAALIGN